MATSNTPSHPAEAIEREVRGNILAQKLGGATVADLALPDELVTRIADRVIRASFEAEFRPVVPDYLGVKTWPDAQPLATPPSDSQPSPNPSRVRPACRVIDVPESPPSLASWREERPPNRAFIASLTNDESPVAPDELPPSEDSSLRAASNLIARRLARDGLLTTLAGALACLDASRLALPAASLARVLRQAGFPVDLLACFPGGLDVNRASREEQALRVLEITRDRVAATDRAPDFSDLVLQFRATNADFRPAFDAGEDAPGLVRLQMTRGDHWVGPGAGDNLDLARAMLASLPNAPFLLSIQQEHLDTLVRGLAASPVSGDGDVAVVPHRAIVSQWAQDNMRPGLLTSAGQSGPVALAPRFPSRGDDGSVFVPGEHAMLRDLSRAGIRLLQSPLLFQGGNIILTPDPASPDGRLALIGEAEIARNVSLGLTPEQAIEAFRVEFAVDRVEVLPAVSYHLDYEVSLRVISRRPGENPIVAAFVNDSRAAVLIMIECTLDALERSRVLPKPRLRAARQHLQQRKWHELVGLLGVGVIAPEMARSGGCSESFARIFSAGPGDNGIATLHRVLLAIDAAMSWPESGSLEGLSLPAQTYMRTLQRRDADRAMLHDRLRALGFQVTPVPSTAEGDRSVNAINGVHGPGAYLMPCWGGVFRALDQAAAAAFRGVLGPEVAVHLIPSAESQCRNGAVHCSASIFPAAVGQ